MDDVIARNLKTCRRCQRTKPRTAEYFGSLRGVMRDICKTCMRIADRARYRANREAMLAKKKAARAADRDGHRARSRAYYAKNKPYINALAAARYRADPIRRIRGSFRSRFIKVLKAKGLKKRTSWQALVGYSVHELRAHIESLLVPPMTWANYGVYWQIDHKRPVSSFKLPEQIRECWALSNLQPLPKLDNHRKGARYDLLTEQALSCT